MVSFWHSQSLLSCLEWRWGHIWRRPRPTALLPRPRLHYLILSQRGCEAGRSHGQGACSPHTPSQAVPLVRVWCLVLFHLHRGAQPRGGRSNHRTPAKCQQGAKPRGSSSVATGRNSRPWRSRRPRACPAGITPLPPPSRN